MSMGPIGGPIFPVFPAPQTQARPQARSFRSAQAGRFSAAAPRAGVRGQPTPQTRMPAQISTPFYIGRPVEGAPQPGDYNYGMPGYQPTSSSPISMDFNQAAYENNLRLAQFQQSGPMSAYPQSTTGNFLQPKSQPLGMAASSVQTGQLPGNPGNFGQQLNQMGQEPGPIDPYVNASNNPGYIY